MSLATYAGVLDAVRGIGWPALRRVRSAVPGPHVSRVRGTTAEFVEYRPYRQGDEPKKIDWKLVARTDRVYIRLSQERAILPTMLVLDASGSMAFPTTTNAKWELARFGMLATEVSGMILDEWHFPSEVIEAVQHHQLLDGVGRGNPFACTLNLAGAIAMAEGLALPGEVLCWKSAPDVLATVGLDEEAFEEARAAAVERFDAQRAALR